MFNVYEGEIAILRRLEFSGNVFTKDKVIRREMILREGDLFRFAMFKDSVLRVKQLGLVDVEKDPDIKPTPPTRPSSTSPSTSGSCSGTTSSSRPATAATRARSSP